MPKTWREDKLELELDYALHKSILELSIVDFTGAFQLHDIFNLIWKLSNLEDMFSTPVSTLLNEIKQFRPNLHGELLVRTLVLQRLG